MIAAVLSILSIEEPTNKEILLYTDCDSILKISNKLIVNPLHASSNCGVDLLAHIHPIVPHSTIKFHKVKGHDDSNPNSLNHLVDYLTHFHENALPPPIQVIANFTLEPRVYENQFRFSNILRATNDHDGVRNMLKSIHDNLKPARH